MLNSQKITKKQQEILHLLFRFRFINRIQIQQFLHHKDRKTINEWLKDLVEKNYIKRIYIETFPEKTKPAIYYLAKGGIGFFKSEGIDKALLGKLYYENIRSEDFINRSQLLADIYLDLADPKDKKADFTMTVVSDYPTHPLTDPLANLLPSAYVEQKNKKQTDFYFIEIIPDIPIGRIRERLKKYISFYESNEWEGATGEDLPVVLTICPNIQTLIYIKRFLKRKMTESNTESFTAHFTTVDKAKKFGITGDIWET